MSRDKARAQLMGCVISGGRVAWMVEKGCPKSFKHCGAYYVLDRDYNVAVEYYMRKEE